MTRCVLAKRDGDVDIVDWEQKSIASRIGPDCGVTFVGAKGDIVAVARVDSASLSTNPVCSRVTWMDPVGGDVVFVATDDKGEEIDLDVSQLTELFPP